MMLSPEDFGIAIPDRQRGRVNLRIACPQCQRSARDDALGLTFETGGTWVAHCFRCGWRASSGHARAIRQIAPSAAITLPALPAQNETLSDRWRTFWQACAAWPGTPVETYLRARGCALPPADADLRFHPAAWHWIERCELAAMVALATDALTGESRTLHLTFLRPDGSSKADIQRSKLLLPKHRKAGAVVRLWPDDAVTFGLAVAEGIETALAAAHAYAPVWACVDAGNLAAMPVLTGVESLLIAADHDLAGLRAADELAARWHAAGREVRIATPDAKGADLADEACA